MSNVMEILFLRLWTKAVGTPDYDKEEWKTLQRALEKEVYKPDTLHAFQAGPVLLHAPVWPVRAAGGDEVPLRTTSPQEFDKCPYCKDGVLHHIPYRGPSGLRCTKCGRVPQEPPTPPSVFKKPEGQHVPFDVTWGPTRCPGCGALLAQEGPLHCLVCQTPIPSPGRPSPG